MFAASRKIDFDYCGIIQFALHKANCSAAIATKANWIYWQLNRSAHMFANIEKRNNRRVCAQRERSREAFSLDCLHSLCNTKHSALEVMLCILMEEHQSSSLLVSGECFFCLRSVCLLFLISLSAAASFYFLWAKSDESLMQRMKKNADDDAAKAHTRAWTILRLM